MDIWTNYDIQLQLNTSRLYHTCGVNKNTTPGYCPEVFDANLYLISNVEICWPETPPGTLFNETCPDIPGFDNTKHMYKECLKNGSWYITHVNGNETPFVNYTECFDKHELEFLTFINKMTVVGYGVSLAALIVALIIFLSFRSLKCTRIRIHTQLFISFILNNVMWIIWYEDVIPYVHITLANPLWCQVLHVFKEYFMIANYMWMFCEGLHLHLALVVVFVREERTMRWFYVIGWGAPIIIIVIHNSVRYFYSRDTDQCWIDESGFSHWFLSIPVLVILGVCAVFLVNVLRIILTIMHPNSPNPAPLGIKRAARAAIILIPLFGIQYILLPTMPDPRHPMYHFYLWLTFIIVPFQGFFCACLFCFANHDVCQVLKSCFYNLKQTNTRFSSYRYTGGADSAGTSLNGGSLLRKSTMSTKL